MIYVFGVLLALWCVYLTWQYCNAIEKIHEFERKIVIYDGFDFLKGMMTIKKTDYEKTFEIFNSNEIQKFCGCLK